jgi:biotin operon repressor
MILPNEWLERIYVESEIEKEILNAYEDGLSLRAVAKKMGCSHLHVWKTMKKLRPNALRPQRNPRKYHFIDDYFSEYTEENSYWMGFISADGHVGVKRGRIEIKLHSKDVDRLIAFRNVVKGDFPIYRYNTRPHVSVVMFSRKMINDLTEKGIGPKASALRIPLDIPDTCARHFIRGCFDGDGSISLSRAPNGSLRPTFQILGSKCLLEWMSKKLVGQAGVESSINVRLMEGCWALCMGSRRSLIKIKHYFYDNVAESLYMNRKKEKLDRICSVAYG